jgi:hypothetical protein
MNSANLKFSTHMKFYKILLFSSILNSLLLPEMVFELSKPFLPEIHLYTEW